MHFQPRYSLSGLRRRWVVAVCLATGCLWALPAQAQQPVPEIPAFLPMAHTVPQGEASPIDGEWVITSIGKRIRIQKGRAFAVDSWLHMFVLRIQPMMVVLKDIRRTQPGQYTGQDLPLVGTWIARLNTDGSLSVNVQSVIGPVAYTLMPVSQDDPQAFAQEKNGNYQSGGGEDMPSQPNADDDGEEVNEEGTVDEEEW